MAGITGEVAAVKACEIIIAIQGDAVVISAYFEVLEDMTTFRQNQGFLIKIKLETVQFTLPYLNVILICKLKVFPNL